MIAARRSNRVAAGMLAALAFSGVTWAQKPLGLPGNYPSKPVRVLLTSAPGGGVDFSARTVLGKLGERWGVTFVPDGGMAGASGLIAMEAGAKAAPDGYTLVLAASGSYTPTITNRFAYNPRTAFRPIAQFALGAVLVGAHPGEPYNDMKGMIAYAKANPGKLSYGATGQGGTLHLTGELIQYLTGIKIVYVPYKGTGQSVIDAIAGRVNLVIVSTTALVPHVRAGKMKSLGVTSLNRLPSIPDLPTLAEPGLPGFDYSNWFGLIGPVGMNPAIVNVLNADINRIINTPEVTKIFVDQGSDVHTGTPEQFRLTIVDFLDMTEKLIKEIGLKFA